MPRPPVGPLRDDRDVTPRPEPTAALHAVRSGDRGPTVVLVHGFTQTHVSWTPVAADLAADHRVVAVDAPGHAGSADITADLVDGAALLGRTGSAATGAGDAPAASDVGDVGGVGDVGDVSDRRAVYVGYSMGGRLALRLALDRPELVAGLVLIGATAGIDDADERANRRARDEALAHRIGRDGVARFLDGWLDQPLFADLDIRPADRAARLANPADGLASSLRLAGTGTMDPPWWAELAGLSVPTLVVAGGHDQKFTALGERLVRGIGPSASFATVDGAGHAAHLQEPAVFADLVRRFIADLPAAPRPGRWV